VETNALSNHAKDSTPLAHPRRARGWLLAVRPATVPASVVPVIIGSAAAAAEGRFCSLPFVAAFVASILIQIGTNLANDCRPLNAALKGTARLHLVFGLVLWANLLL
jgi:1,4-dihydroxy-2-naphthoate polyprenyltransferase